MTVQGTTTNFVYDGLNPVQEKNGATVTANLLTGLGIDEFFTRTDGVGVRSLLPDALGSTVALGDSTGTLQTQYTYEPFGYVTQTGQANTSSYKYTGREDDGSGLDYYRARYYHPRLQRFIAEDPIGFTSGDFNLYAYVGGNPISRTDPLGLFSPAEHVWITKQALNGNRDCKDLPSLVAEVDLLTGSQRPENSYWHAMSNGKTGQTRQEAEKLYNSYVESNLASGT
jgi:RHS repeat-associated protein